jgi:hypothetical protein
VVPSTVLPHLDPFEIVLVLSVGTLTAWLHVDILVPGESA